MLHVFCMKSMQKTCKLQGGFNKEMEFLDICFSDFTTQGCTNPNIFVDSFGLCNLLLILTDGVLAHYLCIYVEW